MRRAWQALVAVWILGSGSGCTTEEAANAASGGASAAGGAAGTGGTTPTGGSGGTGGAAQTVTVSGVVSDYFPFATDPPKPIEGVQVCLHESDIPCAKTDAAGAYSLSGVPGNAEIALLFTKDEYARQVLVYATTLEDLSADLRLPSKILGALFGEAAGFTVPPIDAGIIMGGTAEEVAVDGGTAFAGLDGSTFSLSPKAGKGPVYGADDSPLPNLSATATGKSGTVGWGDVPPGEYTITVTHPGRTCTIEGRGWPTGVAGSVRTPVIAGYGIRDLFFVCK